jgi:nucleotide-binding universal stress UspA family protein
MKKVLIAIDFSDVTPRVLEYAKTIAKSCNSEVRLIHVVPLDVDFVAYSPGGIPPIHAMGSTATERDLRIETERLAMLMEQLKREGVNTCATVLEGPVVPTIVDEAKEWAADMAVMGSHGHSALYELFVGSITEGVLRRATMPVMIVPSRS